MTPPERDTAALPHLDAAGNLASHAVAALMDEAMLTPKPGLVDMRGSGAHRDLTWMLMCQSACALRPAYLAMAAAGASMVDASALRRRIGAIGRMAERTMLDTSGGVNTHRGAIYALGLLVTAAARWPQAGAEQIARGAGELARLDDPDGPARTGHKGERARLEHGVGGARGQAQAGFPQVRLHALPMLRACRARGDSEAVARVNALLAVMAHLDDTCVLARGGAAALSATQRGALQVLARGGIGTVAGRAAFARLEARMRRLHVSPGGAADLLAATLLLDRVERTREPTVPPSNRSQTWKQ
ncbi:MAG: triphosphoribosyl-dephospho-CoA synthase [Gammaproteobacteria bacterium]